MLLLLVAGNQKLRGNSEVGVTSNDVTFMPNCEIGRLVQKLNGGHNLHFKDGKRLNGQKEQKKRGGILKKK